MPSREPNRIFALAMAILVVGCTTSRSRLHFLNGERLWQKGQFETSLREYERSIELEPKSLLAVQAKERIAYTLAYSLARPRVAEAVWEELIAWPGLNPSQKAAWIRELAWIKLEDRRDARAALNLREESMQIGGAGASACEPWNDVARWVRGLVVAEARDEAVTLLRGCRSEPRALVMELQLVQGMDTHQEATAKKRDQSLMEAAGSWVMTHPEDQLAGEIAFEMAGVIEVAREGDTASQRQEAKKWLLWAEKTHPHPTLVQRRLERLEGKVGKSSPPGTPTR